MSKMIKISPEDLEKLHADFDTILRGIKVFDGKITFQKSLENVPRKATLTFTERAYIKMLALVRNFDSEVAWHGTAARSDNPDDDEYIVSDIFVYPQEVGSANVIDQGEYYKWLYSDEMEEAFDDIRMQGHSHVNMGTTPSGVDNTMYEQILSMTRDDDFYIFIIWNKRNEKTIKIYDMKKNVMFENNDVTIKVVDDGIGVQKFLENAKNLVRERRYTPPVSAPKTTAPASTYPSYVTPTYKPPVSADGTKKAGADTSYTNGMSRQWKKKKKAADFRAKGGSDYDTQRV